MLDETQEALGALLQRSVQVFDLSQPLENGMPCSPSHPGFHMALMRRHGDLMRGAGSGSNEMIIFGGHVGTHVDALAHVAAEGQLHGGIDAVANSVDGRHRALGAETIAPMLCRGRLFDIPGARELECLPAGYGVTVDDLQAAAGEASVEPGDVVLVRTGWPQQYEDPEAYVGHRDGAPGVTGPAAEWLADRGVRAIGTDTIAFDQILPGLGHSQMPAHHILLVQRGIHIIEVLNLEELAEHGATVFWFLMIPLRLVGATGSPVRPLAIVDSTAMEVSR
ncbi:cyclase [Aeromicrobium sp. PE09-221]|uniref:cyclase family protein n=1 Tax=Aeromicrobium sp. PE09-221 TaxID=1898043 RepID=UPI000B3EB479|nr:cyclase family protein [Aeromicrobium sp. PE09-221]OUZ09470.1 cyclase [Aeromicrobium sp. PE09-221]